MTARAGSAGPRWASLVAALALCCAACGGDGAATTEVAGGPGPAGWSGVDVVGIEAVGGSAGDGSSITVRTEPVPVEAPDGSCAATVTVRADEYGGESAEIVVSVEVRADRPRLADPPRRDEHGAPIPWDGCALEPRVATVDLEHGVGRPVVDPFGSRFWLRDGEWVGCDHVVTTCVVAPASCDNLRDVVANTDVPRHAGLGEVRCEEPFAVVEVDVGAAGCPATGDPADNPCAGAWVRRTYWRIEDGAWVAVGADAGPGCGGIPALAPDFPSHLCADLPALG